MSSDGWMQVAAKKQRAGLTHKRRAAMIDHPSIGAHRMMDRIDYPADDAAKVETMQTIRNARRALEERRPSRGYVFLHERQLGQLPRSLRRSLIRNYPLPAEHDRRHATKG